MLSDKGGKLKIYYFPSLENNGCAVKIKAKQLRRAVKIKAWYVEEEADTGHLGLKVSASAVRCFGLSFRLHHSGEHQGAESSSHAKVTRG